MFSSLPFSTDTFSSLGINLVEGVSLLDAIAVIEAKAGLKLEDTASIEGVAILTADGTLTLGGASAELSAVVDILANATVRTDDAKIFIWTAPSRSTTWSFSEVYSGEKLIWVIPTGVGASTWVIPN
tara:strand:- start:77 stop:457 length:381 start_codon:yes stop_codon:yes gene_type:complete